MTAWPYDLIADFYDEDIGRNATGEDVDWYVDGARRASDAVGGPILELGCGTGRVTLPLAKAGLDVVALDRSVPMLEKLRGKAVDAGLTLLLLASDMTMLATEGEFAAILCPFSAFCYLVDPASRVRMLADVRRQLKPGGLFMLDVFIPDPSFGVEAKEIETVDYARAMPPGPWSPATSLTRSKKIAFNIEPGVNRVERRYRFLDSRGKTVRELATTSMVRPWCASTLKQELENAGFADVAVFGGFDPARPAQHPAPAAAALARKRA